MFSLKHLGITAGIFLIIGAFLFYKFGPAKTVPQFVEVQKLVKDTSEIKAQKKSLIKEYNCSNGALSKEIAIDEEIASKIAREQSEIVKKPEPQKYLSFKFGGGLQLHDVESPADLLKLDKIKPQFALGAEYDGYEGLLTSDVKSNHGILVLKSWSWK